MTKLTLFIRTIGIIWVIVLFRLSLSLSVFWDNLLKIWSSMLDFKFVFSFSHSLNLTALCILLYFIHNWIYDHEEKVPLNTKKRYLNTLKDHDSFFVKLFFVFSPLAIILFNVLAFINLPQIPEILVLIFLFTVIGFFEYSKVPKILDNSVKKLIYLQMNP